MNLGLYADARLINREALSIELNEVSRISALKHALETINTQLDNRFKQNDNIRELVFGRASDGSTHCHYLASF